MDRKEIIKASFTGRRILFVSDIHFGAVYNRDNKTKYQITDARNSSIIKLVKQIDEIKPDYIVFGGDVIDYSSARTSDEYDVLLSTLIELISSSEVVKSLYKEKKIIIVPGNHDIDIATNSCRYQKNDCFKSLISPQAGSGENNRYCYSVEDRLIIYPFNSNTPVDNSQIFVTYDKSDKVGEAFHALAEAYNEIQTKTLAEVSSSDIALFKSDLKDISNRLEESNDSINDFLIIAVVHHQTSSIATFVEMKEFEGICNCGEFKKALSEQNVKLLLHGHKHWPALYYDSTISDEKILTTISGGTICTENQHNSNREHGFYVIDYSPEKYNYLDVAFINLDDVSASNIKNDSVYLHDSYDLLKSAFPPQLTFSSISARVAQEMMRILRTDFSWPKEIDLKDEEKYNGSAFGTAIGIAIMEQLKPYAPYLAKKKEIVKRLISFSNDSNNVPTFRFKRSHDSTPEGILIEASCWVAKALLLADCIDEYSQVLKNIVLLFNERREDLLGVNPGRRYYRSNVITLSLILKTTLESIRYLTGIGFASTEYIIKDVVEICDTVFRKLFLAQIKPQSNFIGWSESTDKGNEASAEHTAHVFLECKKFVDSYPFLQSLGLKNELVELFKETTQKVRNYLLYDHDSCTENTKKSLPDRRLNIKYADGEPLGYGIYTDAIVVTALLECGVPITDATVLCLKSNILSRQTKCSPLWLNENRKVNSILTYNTCYAIEALNALMEHSI